MTHNISTGPLSIIHLNPRTLYTYLLFSLICSTEWAVSEEIPPPICSQHKRMHLLLCAPMLCTGSTS